jgi:hypothetical protein
MNNLSFIVNVGAYAAMGPAAALYCKTLINILTVLNAAVDTYIEEYEEKSAIDALSEFDRFYSILDRSIGFKAPGTLSVVLSSYFSKYNIESNAQKVLFKLFFIKEMVQFAEQIASNAMPLTTPQEKEAASNSFETLVKSQSKQGVFQTLIRKLSAKPKRNNITLQIRKHIRGVLEAPELEGYEKYFKDDKFKMRELDSYLAENFIEGDIMRKTSSSDDKEIEQVNDFKMLIKDIQRIGSDIL